MALSASNLVVNLAEGTGLVMVVAVLVVAVLVIAVMVVAVAVHILVDNLGSSCLDTLDGMVVLVATRMWVAVLVTAVLAADATLMVVDTHSLVAIRHMVVC